MTRKPQDIAVGQVHTPDCEARYGPNEGGQCCAPASVQDQERPRPSGEGWHQFPDGSWLRSTPPPSLRPMARCGQCDKPMPCLTHCPDPPAPPIAKAEEPPASREILMRTILRLTREKMQLRDALAWASEAMIDARATCLRHCGLLGYKLCPMHQALFDAAALAESADRGEEKA